MVSVQERSQCKGCQIKIAREYVKVNTLCPNNTQQTGHIFVLDSQIFRETLFILLHLLNIMTTLSFYVDEYLIEVRK
jgi:hypothetical protein